MRILLEMEVGAHSFTVERKPVDPPPIIQLRVREESDPAQ